MERKKITFDSFIRGILITLVVVGIFFLIKRLSSALLPFVIGWLIAYWMYPLVRFFQYRCKMKYRLLAMLAAFATVVGVIWLIVILIVPPMLEDFVKVKDMLVSYVQGNYNTSGLSATIHQFLSQKLHLTQFTGGNFDLESFSAMAKEIMPKVWNVLNSSFRAVSSILSIVMMLLYIVFILLDYERLSEGWKDLLPKKIRKGTITLVSDVETGMNRYFRGQALVALCVGILFCIGFLIIGFPMAIPMGLMMGALAMVPYLHFAGFIPIFILAAVKSAETGQSFWLIILLVIIIFTIVQIIEDGFLTPKIMGKVTGLSPAIILLSLSIWGSLLGILGMIIALPMTTILLSYYKNYVLKQPAPTDLETTDHQEDVND
ncbi:MAG: AI-2E family transporter [Bacteroidales bacterium]|nr:AI-2E family transporter [Bacteroidales bacterium]